MLEDSGERTEQPTILRRQEAALRGQVARSGDLASACAAVAAIAALAILGGGMMKDLVGLMSAMLASHGDLAETAKLFWPRAGALAGKIAVVFTAAVAASAVMSIVQVGSAISAEPVKPKLERISPLGGLKKMFSTRSIVRGILIFCKIVGVGTAVYFTITRLLPQFAALPSLSGEQAAGRVGGMLLTMCAEVAIIMLLLAVADYLYQRWQHEQDLKITRRQLLADLRQMQGDPQVKAEMKQRLQPQHADSDAKLDDSAVLVVSPSGKAVAIEYRPASGSPRIAARAAGASGRRLRNSAQQKGLPVVENKRLADSLYRASRYGRKVPATLGEHVAEVLAYAMQVSREGPNNG